MARTSETIVNNTGKKGHNCDVPDLWGDSFLFFTIEIMFAVGLHWFSSVQLLSHVRLWPYGLKHPMLPCTSPMPRACSNSCPSSQWHHPTISSSVVPFSSRLQSFPASRSLPMSQFLTSGSQSIGVSASESVLPMNIQDWFSFRMDWLDLLAVHGTLKSLLQHHSSKVSILWRSAFFIV